MAIARIEEFITAISSATDECVIKEICDGELTYLRNTLGISWEHDKASGLPIGVNGSVTGLHNQLTKYRNAVKQLALTESNSYQFVKGRTYVTQHIALKHLVKAPIETLVRGERISSSKYETHINIVKLGFDTVDDICSKAESLLDQSGNRQSYVQLALGLMLLTGRRATEILKTATFEYIDDETVLFNGQLKTKGSSNAQIEAYPIPVLCDANTIIKALRHLRELRDFSEIDNKAVHSKSNKTLNETVKRHFGEYIPGVSPKSLRAVYAAICDFTYRSNTSMSREAYLAKILGHSDQDIVTAQSYEGFEIVE